MGSHTCGKQKKEENGWDYYGEQPIGICVGADETFYGLPILVAIELGSGFIFSEAPCENRTYETWWEQVSGCPGTYKTIVNNGIVEPWSVMERKRWSSWLSVD